MWEFELPFGATWWHYGTSSWTLGKGALRAVWYRWGLIKAVGQRIHQPVKKKKKRKAKAEPPCRCVWAGEIHAMLFRGAFPQRHILFTEELKLSYT